MTLNYKYLHHTAAYTLDLEYGHSHNIRNTHTTTSFCCQRMEKRQLKVIKILLKYHQVAFTYILMFSYLHLYLPSGTYTLFSTFHPEKELGYGHT